MQYEQFDLKKVIQDIREGLDRTECPDIGVIEEYKNDTIIRADRGRLHIILRNLITNGFKYRNKEIRNACVKIIYTRTGNWFNIVIEDNGQGIADESLDKVFDMFYRGTATGNGSGLGLYICKEMLDKINARYNLCSAPGKGTSFTISLCKSATSTRENSPAKKTTDATFPFNKFPGLSPFNQAG